MEVSLEVAAPGGTYQKRLEAVRKYCASQGIPLNSPRARKYAESQGVTAADLGIEITDDASPERARESQRNYARATGKELNDPNVRKYVASGAENEPIDEVTLDAAYKNETFKAAVLHYAHSQDRSIDDPAVQKYALGLLKPTGDFSQEKRDEKYTRETIEARIAASVERYASSMGLSVDDPQVKKYEQGQRKGPYKALLENAVQ